MPEWPWRRDRSGRATRAEEAARLRQDAATARRSRREARAGHLRRAADCHLRAGGLTEAASCLAKVGTPMDTARAAELFLEAGEHEQAARALLEASRNEAAAWIYAHHLGDTARAREVLDLDRRGGARPSSAEVWPGPDGVWIARVERVGERLADLSDAPAVNTVVGAVLGGSFGYDDVEQADSALRENAANAVRDRKFEVAYAAQSLGRLVEEFRDEHDAFVRRAERDKAEQAGRVLAWRQVQARCDVAEKLAGQRTLEVLAETRRAAADTSTAHYAERTETWGVAIAEAMRRYDQAALIFAAAVSARRPGAAERWRAWSVRVLDADPAIPEGWETA